jgi:hypothetical protein
LTLKRLQGFSASASEPERGTEGMAGETDDPEGTAERVEAALERIAQLARPAHMHEPVDETDKRSQFEEIANRLDRLIDKLREALGSGPT